MEGPGAVWGRILAASAVVAVIMAVSGGFGTGFLAVVPRAAYWIGLCAVGTAIGIFTARTIMPSGWFDRRPWVAWGLVWLAISAPMTVIVTLTTALLRHRSIGFAGVVEILPDVLATTAGMTALAFLVRRHAPTETHAAAAGGPPAKFLERLPANLEGADLWAVEAQDHYLRLHTSKGRALILLRLADAVAELEGIEGARTHRSWWVARAAVSEAVRGDGRATLTLVDGGEAPVSRAYAAALRAAGWF
jgi:hypothetical protein